MAPKSLLPALAWAGVSLGAVLEQAHVLPDGWQQLSEQPDASDKLLLSIALRHPHIDGMKSRIESRSHMSRSEVQEMRAPDQQDVDDVMKWLNKNGMANSTVQNGDWIQVSTTVGKAESLLDMTMARFAYEDKAPVLRTKSYSIPDSLTDAIKFVHPIANFMSPKNDLSSASLPLDARAVARDDSPCAQVTNPNCIRELYGIPSAAEDESSIRFGLAGFLEEYANYEDAQTFLNSSSPSIASTGYNFSVELVNGGQNSQDLSMSGQEAALDIDYALALGYPTDITYYSTGGRGQKLDNSGKPLSGDLVDNEPYHALVESLLDKPDGEIPHVLSVSYADDELSVPRPYAERVCHLFGLLTARGTSILVGSGDGGARGGRKSNCRTNDGTDKDVTMSVFPASCPWVTAVGAVTNNANPVTGAGFSGGGFSQYFSRPSWQDSAVESYVDALDGHLDGYYNASMRAVPDIAAIGTRFAVIVAGQRNYLEGTSASTPVVAAMIALVNDARVRQGKAVLGWLNELLYSDEVNAVLQDVTAGESQSCKFQGNKTPGGWPAKEGYDAITGLGVPADFQKFLDVLVDA